MCLVPRELDADMSGINFSKNHIFQILFIKTSKKSGQMWIIIWRKYNQKIVYLVYRLQLKLIHLKNLLGFQFGVKRSKQNIIWHVVWRMNIVWFWNRSRTTVKSLEYPVIVKSTRNGYIWNLQSLIIKMTTQENDTLIAIARGQERTMTVANFGQGMDHFSIRKYIWYRKKT